MSEYLPAAATTSGIRTTFPCSRISVGNGCNIAREQESRGGLVQGTRAHQIGLYFVFDSPFEMMCDSPSRYMRDPATPRFITSVPTVFDETFVQDGKVGEFIVTVRRAGDTWYVGGITNFTARDIDLDLSFLPSGKTAVREQKTLFPFPNNKSGWPLLLASLIYVIA